MPFSPLLNALIHTQQPVPTCGDYDLSHRGAQSWFCNPANGLAQNANATVYPNPSDAVRER
jgi:hypothetical protein